MMAKQAQGTCQFCGVVFAKSAASRHYPKCGALQTAMEKQAKKKAEQETLYCLRVEPDFRGPFWLDLEMRASSSLETLDSYLRAIWLECCGHMSEFTDESGPGDEIAMGSKAGKVFKSTVRLTHTYDFGTSSVTTIKCTGTRSGQPLNARPIALLARNVSPEMPCVKCGGPSLWICGLCSEEEGRFIWLCEEHADDHECGEECILPMMNSPRVGMCGYTGPANPPY